MLTEEEFATAKTKLLSGASAARIYMHKCTPASTLSAREVRRLNLLQSGTLSERIWEDEKMQMEAEAGA